MHQKKILSRTLSAATAAILTLGFFSACKSEEQPPPQYPQQPQPYGAQPYGAQPYGAQPQPYGAAPAPTPAPAPVAAPAPTPAATGQMSQPSPMAFACQSDAQCLTHRCNTQFGKCAWPCQSDADCVTGNRCQAGACIPGQ
jgi:hypothetical protein